MASILATPPNVNTSSVDFKVSDTNDALALTTGEYLWPHEQAWLQYRDLERGFTLSFNDFIGVQFQPGLTRLLTSGGIGTGGSGKPDQTTTGVCLH